MKDTSIDVLCRGFIDGGMEIVTNFPGFYSHDIFSKLGGKDISINERVAFEIAYGVSLAGKRSLVTMKNVGLNATADPFIHSLIAGVKGGLVLVVTDDMEVIASQERQDSRHYFDFFGGLWFEPNSLKSAYTIARNSFFLSEKYDTPVVIRLTNQFFSLNGNYQTLGKKKYTLLPANNPEKYIVYPVYWKKQYDNLKDKNKKINDFVENFTAYSPPNIYARTKGVIVVGSCWKEYGKNYKGWDTLCIETYPIPINAIKKFIKSKEEISILEQGDTFVYNIVKKLLNSDDGKVKILSSTGIIPDLSSTWITWNHLRNLFLAIRSVKPSFVVGDVGQFTVESTHTIKSCLCLGSAVGTGIGLVLGGVEYPFSVVGDTSFLHSGIQALTEATARNIAMGIIIIDNNGSAATGGQKLISSIYSIDDKIKKFEIDYKHSTEKEIRNILLAMRKSKLLSVVYVKI